MGHACFAENMIASSPHRSVEENLADGTEMVWVHVGLVNQTGIGGWGG